MPRKLKLNNVRERQRTGREVQRLITITSIAEGLVYGMTIDQIAKQLDLTPASVRRQIETAVADLMEQSRGLMEQWQHLSLQRSELIMGRVMRSIMKTPEDEDVDHKLIRDFTALVKSQREIMAPVAEAPKGGSTTNIHIEQTITTGSSLYRTILAEAHNDVIEGELADEDQDEPLLLAADNGFKNEMLDKLVDSEETPARKERIRERFDRLWREAESADEALDEYGEGGEDLG